MPRMLEIIGGHDQAKSFLRTDVSKVLKKSRINCGESQIFVSRVTGPDHLGFTREIQICDSPQLMPRMLEIIGRHDQAKYFLRTDVSKVLKKFRINCGESQIFVSRAIGPAQLGWNKYVFLSPKKIALNLHTPLILFD